MYQNADKESKCFEPHVSVVYPLIGFALECTPHSWGLTYIVALKVTLCPFLTQQMLYKLHLQARLFIPVHLQKCSQ